MKRSFAFFISLMVLFAFLSSCEKETILSIDQTSINFTDNGGSQTVSLTANKPWTVSSSQSWCKVSPSAGEEATSSRISITCDSNTTYDSRTATVTFTCAELTKTVSISQATNNGLLLSQTSYELTKDAQQLNIDVKANVKFSVEVDNGCKDWVKYNTTKGLTTSTVVLDIAENTSYDGREGKVTIKQDGGSLSSTVTIKQSQLDGLFLTTSEYNLTNEKHTLTVEVKSNIDFEVKSEADWIKYVETKGLKTNQIILNVAANETYDDREGKVIVKQKNGSLTGTITVKQDEKYGILVSQSEYSLTNEAQTIEVEVKYNVDFDVLIPSGCKDWIKQVSTKALNNRTFSLSIDKNETYDSREGSITFKQKKGDLSATVYIKQAQMDFLEVAKKEYTVDIDGETIIIEVTSNVDYSVVIGEDAQSWLTKVDTKGLSKENISIVVSPGDDDTDRKGNVVISYGDISHTVSIHQYSYAANTIIQFADEKVKAKLVEAFDTNKDGELSMREAKVVTSLEGVFGATKTYYSFDEFQFFTGIQTITNELFSGWRLKTIILPESIISIGAKAFNGCTDLTSLLLPEKVNTIMEEAFMGCTALTSINIPSTITDISNSCFSGCSSLNNVIIPEGVTQLGAYSFCKCISLTSIVLPETLSTISYGAFQGCTKLKDIFLPTELTNINNFAFDRCESLSSILLPEKLKTLGSYAFNRCYSLSSISIPNSISAIEDHTFAECTSLKTVIIPDSVASIGEYAFWGCPFETITIPESVSTIMGGAFNSTRLTSIVIPSSVSFMGSGMFAWCSKLTKVVLLPDTPPTLGGDIFYEAAACPIYVPDDSVENYKTSSGWKDYKDRIKGISADGASNQDYTGIDYKW